MENKKIKIYTDGAASGNPGPAGWGVVVLTGGKVVELGGSNPHATNNQMELTAAIEALKYVKLNKLAGEVEVFSDSKYVILGITEWIRGWMNNNWKNAAKKPVMNRELWEDLFIFNREVKPRWTYVQGHAENKWNERADQIAVSFGYGDPVKLRK